MYIEPALNSHGECNEFVDIIFVLETTLGSVDCNILFKFIFYLFLSYIYAPFFHFFSKGLIY